jgi:hypothetical protein
VFIATITLDDAMIDCATACWFKHNIINLAYDLGFLDGQGGQNEAADLDATIAGTEPVTVNRR